MSQPANREVGSVATINEGLQGQFTTSGRRGRTILESYMQHECEKRRLELIAAKGSSSGAKPPKASI